MLSDAEKAEQYPVVWTQPDRLPEDIVKTRLARTEIDAMGRRVNQVARDCLLWMDEEGGTEIGSIRMSSVLRRGKDVIKVTYEVDVTCDKEGGL